MMTPLSLGYCGGVCMCFLFYLLLFGFAYRMFSDTTPTNVWRDGFLWWSILGGLLLTPALGTHLWGLVTGRLDVVSAAPGLMFALLAVQLAMHVAAASLRMQIERKVAQVRGKAQLAHAASPKALDPDSVGTLITDGPWKLVRHPCYLSYFLDGCAALVQMATPLLAVGGSSIVLARLAITFVFVAAFMFFCTNSASKEERMLLKSDKGHDYAHYAQKVRYRFIPGVY